EGERFGHSVVAAVMPGQLDGRHDQILELHVQVRLRLAVRTGPAGDEFTISDMLSAHAHLKQDRRCLVYEMREGGLLNVRLAGTAAGAGVVGALLGRAPGKAEDLNVVGELLILGFSRYAIELQEHIDRHNAFLSSAKIQLTLDRRHKNEAGCLKSWQGPANAIPG